MFHFLYACSVREKVWQQLRWEEMKLLYIAMRLGRSNTPVSRWNALTWHAAFAHILSTLKFNLSSIQISKALILETKGISLSLTCSCIDDTLWPRLKSTPWNLFGFASLVLSLNHLTSWNVSCFKTFFNKSQFLILNRYIIIVGVVVNTTGLHKLEKII